MSNGPQNSFFRPNGSGSGSSSGSGGTGKNYLAIYKASLGSGAFNTGNGDLELGLTTGFGKGTTGTLTNGIPTGTPTFGSGSNANLSIAIASSSQLAGVYSLDYISSAATTAGDCLHTDAFFIDAEDQAKVLGFKFAYKAQTNPTNGNYSGTSSNSFGVAAYDVTNSSWLGLAGNFNIVQSSGIGYATGTFQTNATTASIRFIVYNVTASAGAITMRFDDFSVGPQVTSIAPSMGEWTAYTPATTQGFGTVTSPDFNYRIVGDSMDLQCKFVAGTTVNSEARVGLPPGFTSAGSPKLASIRLVGKTATTQVNQVESVLIEPSTTYVTFGREAWAGTGTAPITKSNGSLFLTSGDTFEFFATGIPIAGLSSNTLSSASTDTRIVAANVSASATLIGGNTTITPTNIVKDTHAAWSGSTFTAPVSGWYRISGTYQAGSNLDTLCELYYKVNSGTSILLGGTRAPSNTANMYGSGSGDLLLSAGDTVVFIGNHSPGAAQACNLFYASIVRTCGPAVVQATEDVNGRYYASATVISGSLATVVWTTKDFDSHNAMSSGNITMPVSGKYLVNVNVQITGTIALNSQLDMQIQKNTVAISEFQTYAGGAMTAQNAQISDEISCLAGDVVRVQLLSSAVAPAIASGNTKVFVSWARVGN